VRDHERGARIAREAPGSGASRAFSRAG
jgi:hypothetical protein